MVQMSTVWDRTTAFASAALGAIIPIAVVLIFLPVSIQVSLQTLLLKVGVAPRLAVLLLFWAIELLGTLAIIVLALGATQRAGEAFRAALARLVPTIGVFVVLGIAAGLLAAPIGIALAMTGVRFDAMQADMMPSSMTPAIGLFVILYALVYIVLILWATARLLLIEPVILAERRGLGAISRAIAMTRGLTWKIIGVLLLYAIVSTVAVLAAQTVFGSILGLIAPDNDGDIGIATVITAIVVAAVSTGFKVIAAIFVAKLYMAVDAHAEGFVEAI